MQQSSFRDGEKEPRSEGKEHRDGRRIPVERILCIPRSLQRSDTRGIKLTGREMIIQRRWYQFSARYNLVFSLDDERKLIANEIFITVPCRFLFLFPFRGHATTNYYTYIFIRKRKVQLTNARFEKKRTRKISVRRMLELSIPEKSS